MPEKVQFVSIGAVPMLNMPPPSKALFSVKVLDETFAEFDVYMPPPRSEAVFFENVQFFTYYADEDAEKENKPTVAFDFAVEPIEKNVGTVLGETFTQTCSMAKTVWTSLVWLVQGRFTFNDMSGPVGIATAVTQVASMGLQTGFGDAVNNILFVMILITVNLGIVNMLPFPALDGGRFLFLLIEWIFKKPIPRKAEQIVNTVGLVLLLAFMLIISVKDVFQLVTGTFPGM